MSLYKFFWTLCCCLIVSIHATRFEWWENVNIKLSNHTLRLDGFVEPTNYSKNEIWAITASEPILSSSRLLGSPGQPIWFLPRPCANKWTPHDSWIEIVLAYPESRKEIEMSLYKSYETLYTFRRLFGEKKQINHTEMKIDASQLIDCPNDSSRWKQFFESKPSLDDFQKIATQSIFLNNFEKNLFSHQNEKVVCTSELPINCLDQDQWIHRGVCHCRRRCEKIIHEKNCMKNEHCIWFETQCLWRTSSPTRFPTKKPTPSPTKKPTPKPTWPRPVPMNQCSIRVDTRLQCWVSNCVWHNSKCFSSNEMKEKCLTRPVDGCKKYPFMKYCKKMLVTEPMTQKSEFKCVSM